MTDTATLRSADQTLRRNQLRAVISASVGTTIEWYDFFLYGVAAATVFPQKFFPSSDPFIGTMLSFTTFFVGFVARPIGGAIFGHFGDKIGRKKLLVFTMIVMGASTMAVGLTPGYDVIGIWGAVFLTFGRILQGLAIGGQWSGSVLMASEWTDPKRRGFTTSFAQVGAPAGMVLANGALALMTAFTSDQAFLDWGWRVPFLASVALVITGFYIRAGVKETPVFEELKKKGAVVNAPLVKVLRENGREVALTALLRTSQQVCFYIFTTYILTYATTILGFGRGLVLNMVMAMALVSCFANPLFGHLSDKFGRRTITAIGCVMPCAPRLSITMAVVRVLRPAGHEIAAVGVPRDPSFEPPAGFAVRTAGGVHLGEFSRVAALQRLGARLSTCLDYGGRSGAVDCHAAVTGVRDIDVNRVVHLNLLDDQPGVRVPAEGSSWREHRR